MNERGGEAPSLRSWFAAPPRWFGLIGVLALVCAAYGITAKRGVAIGLIAAVVYGFVGLSALAFRPRYRVRVKQHASLDGLLLIPLGFLAFAFLTNWTLWVCAVLPAGLWVAVDTVRRLKARHRAS